MELCGLVGKSPQKSLKTEEWYKIGIYVPFSHVGCLLWVIFKHSLCSVLHQKDEEFSLETRLIPFSLLLFSTKL